MGTRAGSSSRYRGAPGPRVPVSTEARPYAGSEEITAARGMAYNPLRMSKPDALQKSPYVAKGRISSDS